MPHVSYLGVMPGPRTLNSDDDDEHPGENMSTLMRRLLYKNYYNHRRDNNLEVIITITIYFVKVFIFCTNLGLDVCPILSPFTHP